MRLKSILTLLGPFIALLIVFGVFAGNNPRMLSEEVLLNILTQTVIVGIAAIGMALIIISGGIKTMLDGFELQIIPYGQIALPA